MFLETSLNALWWCIVLLCGPLQSENVWMWVLNVNMISSCVYAVVYTYMYVCFQLLGMCCILPLTYALTQMSKSSLFCSAFSSLAFLLYQSLISPDTTGLQAVRTVWSTTGGCRHINSSGTVIIWLFYCWMCCWRPAWGESNIFFATKFLGEDSTAASYSEHRFPKIP